MKKGRLIIFSGLPGSGKSTLATQLASTLGATYLRIDTVEQALRDVCGIKEVEGMGYRLSYRIAQENLRLGLTVIADSVNPEEFTRDEWNAVATDVGSDFINVEIFCSIASEHKSRVENRGPSVKGASPPTWADVQSRDFHAWTDERIAIDTAGSSVETSFRELLELVETKLRVEN